MQFKKLAIIGPLIIESNVFEDKLRGGFFLESYKEQEFKDNGINVKWIQDNHSQSIKGVLRGLHFQKPPYEQDKLIRVVRGKIQDVIVDLRKSSVTYGKFITVELSEENKLSLFVPKGFAHGYMALSEKTDFLYKVSNVYSKESEGGILWSDQNLNINWQIKNPIINDKDKSWATLNKFETPFNY